MKRVIPLSLLILAVGVFVTCGKKEHVPMAKEFVELLVKEDYLNAVKGFDDTMKGVMTQEKLKEAWEGLLAQVGAFKKQAGVNQTKEQGHDIVYVTCEFEKATLDIKVVYNTAKEISGLWFVPSQ